MIILEKTREGIEQMRNYLYDCMWEETDRRNRKAFWLEEESDVDEEPYWINEDGSIYTASELFAEDETEIVKLYYETIM